MAKRKNFTQTMIESLKPAQPGKRYDVMDTQVPGLGVRVASGKRVAAEVRDGKKSDSVVRGTYVFVSRFPGSKSPTRRAIGAIDAMTLAEARDKAQEWRRLLQKGKDPAQEIARQKAAEARSRRNTFGAVAEAFIKDKLPGERKGRDVENAIRHDLLNDATLIRPSEDLPPLKDWPIVEITRYDLKDLIKTKKKDRPAQARNLLGIIKRIFKWAINEEVYGLEVSPAAMLSAVELLGEKKRDTRAFDEHEINAFWHVVRRIPYPVGLVYRLLLLTGLRLNEVADASWKEFNPHLVDLLHKKARNSAPIDWKAVPQGRKEWIIPETRMKGKNGKARKHLVPLTDEMLRLLEEIPVWSRPAGDYVFSLCSGEKPVWITAKVKKSVDGRMLRMLQAWRRKCGDDRATIKAIKLDAWKNHHLRHTVETRLAKYDVGKEVRDAVLAHAKPGMTGTYNHYEYATEKREALELWSARLHDIIVPPPDNVVALTQRK